MSNAKSRPRPSASKLPTEELALVTGQTRSGKTYWVAQRVKHEPRLWVWDSKGEFARSYRCRGVTDPRELHAAALSSRSVRLAFVAPVTTSNFDLWCRLAWVWIRVNARAGHSCALVAEELADVTSPGKAPPAWGEIVRKAMEHHPRIYALTQRPAESDKTILGNCFTLHCHAMSRADDRRAMARELDVDQALVDALRHDRKEWIERSMVTRRLTNGGKGLPTHVLVEG